MKQEGADRRDLVLARLRSRCDAWYDFLAEKGHVPDDLLIIGKEGVESAFNRGSIAGLQMLVKDIEEWKLALSVGDLAEWEQRCAKQ